MQELHSDSSVMMLQSESNIPDSITPLVDSLESVITVYPSLFDTDFRGIHIIEINRPEQHQAFWVPAILVAGFVLLAWSRLFYPRRLGLIFRGIFAKNYANQLIREGNIFNERIGLAMFLVYLSVISMFVYQALPLFDLEIKLSPILTYASILGFFYGFWLLKSLMVRTLSWLYNTAEHSHELLTNMYLFNLFAGIWLLPLVSCMAFAQHEVFFYIILIFITLVYTLRIFRAAVIGINIIKFSVFHLILYLCTLEILPLIVLAKILSRNMNL